MDAKTLKEMITIEQIMFIMDGLGADYKEGRNHNEIMYRTICHGGDSHKLYLYKNSKQFYCYSECGHLDIINIVENVMGLTTGKAINYICKTLGMNSYDMREGFGDDVNQDKNILDYYLNRKEQEVDLSRDFTPIDEKVLDNFYRYYHPAFYNDGISCETMFKYGIRYDILGKRIIIPHYKEDGELIAVRCRNTLQELIDEGKKYMPIYYDGKLLSAPTAKYLFGLYFNKEQIKKLKRVIIFEAEKSVMQLDTMGIYIGVALSSSNMSEVQIQLLKELGVEEVIVALDKEYEKYGSEQEKRYAMKIRKSIIDKLLPHFSVSVIWDKEGLLGLKQSPTDRGFDVFMKLYENRIKF